MKAYYVWMGCCVVSLHPGEDDVRFDCNGFFRPVLRISFSLLEFILSSLCLYPTSYPNPMRQTAARYYLAFLSPLVVLDPLLAPRVLHSLRRSPRDALSCNVSGAGPRPFGLRGAFPGLRVLFSLLLAAVRPPLPLALPLSRRSACSSRSESQFYFPFVDLAPSFLFIPMQSNLLDDLRRLLDRSVSQPLTEGELEQVRTDGRSNRSCEATCRATKR